MLPRRVERVNSLLKEVLSEVIRKDVKDPDIHELLAVTKVEVTKDLHQAKVYVSIIGTEKEREQSLEALTSCAGFIGSLASKKVRLRYFPRLSFILDDTAEKHMRIEEIINDINAERDTRPEST